MAADFETYPGHTRQGKTFMTTTSTRFLSRDGATLAYRLVGDEQNATPLVMVMGWSGVKEDWHGLDARLARHRPVLVLDNRGMGESDLGDGPYTMPQLAADVAAVIEAVGWRHVDVFGVSMGGMIAQTMAVEHPAYIRRLVLGCTTTVGLPEVPADPQTLEQMTLTPNRPAREQVREMLTAVYTEAWICEHPDTFEARIEHSLAYRRPWQGIANQFAAISAFDVRPQLAQIDAPALVLHGDADKLIPLANGQRLAQGLPNADFVHLPQAGHLFWDMAPEATERHVRAFLDADA